MKYGLRIPSFALGSKTISLQDMGKYLRQAEDLGFEYAVSIDHLLLTPPCLCVHLAGADSNAVGAGGRYTHY